MVGFFSYPTHLLVALDALLWRILIGVKDRWHLRVPRIQKITILDVSLGKVAIGV